MKKLIYKAPKFNCIIIWMESSVAAASTGAVINPGTQQQNYPYVEDWQESSGFSNDLEL